jgi:hypothetical protein
MAQGKKMSGRSALSFIKALLATLRDFPLIKERLSSKI